MAVKGIMDLTEKKYSLGFISALITAIVFLSAHVVYKDKQINRWVDKTIACEQDKIQRLDRSLEEARIVLEKTEKLLNNDTSTVVK